MQLPIKKKINTYTIKGNIDIQYRLRQTLQYFERTRTQYEHTEYTIVGVHALMESIGTHMPNRRT